MGARTRSLAHRAHSRSESEAAKLEHIEQQLRTSGNQYWADQVSILLKEVMAWTAEAKNRHDHAVALMRDAAESEDAMEKLPVTPGPIVPAREQLGYLLLQQHQAGRALREFQATLTLAPGRRGAILGVKLASEAMIRTSVQSGRATSARGTPPY